MFVNVNDSATVATDEVGLWATARSSRTMERTRSMNSSSPRLATCRSEVDAPVSFVAGAPLVAGANVGGGVAILADLVLLRVEYGPVRLGAARRPLPRPPDRGMTSAVTDSVKWKAASNTATKHS